MENRWLYTIFAEHYEILLQDIAGAMSNSKRPAVKRCSYVIETIIELFAEIFKVSVKEANKILYDTVFEKDKIHISECDADPIFRKYYLAQSELLGSDKDRVSINAASAVCEIVTIYAEFCSLSYDEAAKRLNEKKGV